MRETGSDFHDGSLIGRGRPKRVVPFAKVIRKCPFFYLPRLGYLVLYRLHFKDKELSTYVGSPGRIHLVSYYY